MDDNDDENVTYEPVQILVVMNEISECTDTLKKTKGCECQNDYEVVLKQVRYQLLNIIQKLKPQKYDQSSICPKEDMERDIFMVKVETELEETKISHLRKEWSQQQKTMARLQDSLIKKCRLLSLHSSYCSSQGSALCAILAILINNQELVESFLQEPEIYLVKFIRIADGCLCSFIKTYSLDIPIEDTNDYRYILALYNCVLHISNLQSGRRFLVNCEDCQVMLSELISILPNIKHSSINPLKLTLVRIVHNVTLEEEGVDFVKHCAELLPSLDECIRKPYEAQMHKYLLEILDRVTSRIIHKDFLDKLTQAINMERLRELSGHAFKEVNTIPKSIFQNIGDATQSFILEKQAQGDVPRDKSVGTPSPNNASKSIPFRRLRNYNYDSENSTLSSSSSTYTILETTSTPYSQVDPDTTSHSIYSPPSSKIVSQRPMEGTLRPSTRRDMVSVSTCNPLKLHSSPCNQTLNASFSNNHTFRLVKSGFTEDLPPSDQPSVNNLISDKFKNTSDSAHSSRFEILAHPELTLSISKLSPKDKAVDVFKSSQICIDQEEPEKDTASTNTSKIISKNKNVQTFTTNSCITYVSRKIKSKAGQPKPDKSKRSKRVHSDYQHTKSTYYCIPEVRPWSAGSKRRKSCLSSVSKQKSFLSSICKKATPTVSDNKKIENVTCTPVATSVDNDNNINSPYDNAISSSSQMDMTICGSSNDRQLVLWNLEDRVVARLTDIDKNVGHYVKNTVRIISRLDNNINRQQQRVVTRIKIPGISFNKLVHSEHKDR